MGNGRGGIYNGHGATYGPVAGLFYNQPYDGGAYIEVGSLN